MRAFCNIYYSPPNPPLCSPAQTHIKETAMVGRSFFAMKGNLLRVADILTIPLNKGSGGAGLSLLLPATITPLLCFVHLIIIREWSTNARVGDQTTRGRGEQLSSVIISRRIIFPIICSSAANSLLLFWWTGRPPEGLSSHFRQYLSLLADQRTVTLQWLQKRHKKGLALLLRVKSSLYWTFPLNFVRRNFCSATRMRGRSHLIIPTTTHIAVVSRGSAPPCLLTSVFKWRSDCCCF